MFTFGPAMRGGLAPLSSSYLWTSTGSVNPGGATLSVGNQQLTWAVSGSANNIVFRSATALSGKVYCEFACITAPATMSHGFGVQESPLGGGFYNTNANGGDMFSGNGGCGLASSGHVLAAAVTSSGSYAFATNDRIGIAFDVATRKLWFRKNGTWISGDPAAGTGQTMTLAGGATFYFFMGAYSCSIGSGSYVYEIYPDATRFLAAAPSGFNPYQP